jgi:monovalent cation:proton antiporter-2 (CPA2) family protein
MAVLSEGAVLLTAAVVAVPLARFGRLGSVLGYLAAGSVIGPEGFALIADVERILHFAEFGVVLLLFVIGLELQPARLWTMRRSVSGLGVVQLLVTGGALALIGRLFGLEFDAAAVVGLALALSSTAFALQMLAERNELTTRHGRTAFSILLFQDLAAIPLLALVPLLAGQADGPSNAGGGAGALQTVGVLALVAVAGRYLLRYAFRIVARTRVREAFTAAALLTVVGTALLMQAVGLSAALGAFVAGVLLAGSEYRHALEADLEPFKGLLLGLFFMAVGMSINLGMIAAEPERFAALVLLLLAVKALVLFALGRASGLTSAAAAALAVAISQGGEFAFVIFGVSVEAAVIDRRLGEQLVAVVTLSMAVSPFLFLAYDGFRRLRSAPGAEPAAALPEEENQVIIAGFGRFGQIVGRILRARHIGFTALNASAEQVDFVARYGNRIHYGDASRLDLLNAAKADRAVVFVLAIDDVEASVRTARTVREHFPKLKIYARARNRQHAYRLMELGIAVVWRETFLSSLDMAGAVLEGLGLPDYAAARAVATFRSHDEARLYGHFGAHGDEKRMQALAMKAAEELERLFAEDDTAAKRMS